MCIIAIDSKLGKKHLQLCIKLVRENAKSGQQKTVFNKYVYIYTYILILSFLLSLLHRIVLSKHFVTKAY
jgi:hypothetical protein